MPVSRKRKSQQKQKPKRKLTKQQRREKVVPDHDAFMSSQRFLPAWTKSK